jgi:hypothetical protein
MRKFLNLTVLSIMTLSPSLLSAQADNEIQVYSSPVTPKAVTFVELHENYTFNGSK